MSRAELSKISLGSSKDWARLRTAPICAFEQRKHNCVFVTIFFPLLQVVPDKMSDSEFSAAAEFGSGPIPKIEYFVVCTAGQVQSSVRDNL